MMRRESAPWNRSDEKIDLRTRRGRKPGLHSSARAFVVFAARGRAHDCAPCGLGEGRSPARARAHRHRQHVRCAGILREDGGRRHSADCRLLPRDRFRRRAARSAQSRSRSQIAAHGAARRERGGLSQLDAVEFARVPGDAAERAIASEIRLARRRNERTDRAHRRAGRRARFRARGRTERSCGCALRQTDGGVRRPSLCRIAAPWHAGGTALRKRAARSRLCQGAAARCHQRAVFRARRRLRSA